MTKKLSSWENTVEGELKSEVKGELDQLGKELGGQVEGELADIGNTVESDFKACRGCRPLPKTRVWGLRLDQFCWLGVLSRDRPIESRAATIRLDHLTTTVLKKHLLSLDTSGYPGYRLGMTPGTRKCRITPHSGRF